VAKLAKALLGLQEPWKRMGESLETVTMTAFDLEMAPWTRMGERMAFGSEPDLN